MPRISLRLQTRLKGWASWILEFVTSSPWMRIKDSHWVEDSHWVMCTASRDTYAVSAGMLVPIAGCVTLIWRQGISVVCKTASELSLESKSIRKTLSRLDCSYAPMPSLVLICTPWCQCGNDGPLLQVLVVTRLPWKSHDLRAGLHEVICNLYASFQGSKSQVAYE